MTRPFDPDYASYLLRVELAPGALWREYFERHWFNIEAVGCMTNAAEQLELYSLNYVGRSQTVRLDMLYLSHLWPNLYTLPQAMDAQQLQIVGAKNEPTLIVLSGLRRL